MHTNITLHAAVRAQKRGVPPIVQNWLLDYGEETYDSHGGVVRYFSAASIRRMEVDLGRVALRRMSEFLRCYLVESSSGGGLVLTVGKRHPKKHVWRH